MKLSELRKSFSALDKAPYRKCSGLFGTQDCDNEAEFVLTDGTRTQCFGCEDHAPEMYNPITIDEWFIRFVYNDPKNLEKKIKKNKKTA